MVFTDKEKIKVNKGWSNDNKYKVILDQDRFLLRVSPIVLKDRIEKLFNMMKKIEALAVPICSPINLDVIDEDIHALYRWIDGYDLNDVIGKFDEDKQYHLGIKSGKHLQKIHSIEAPNHLESWTTRFNKKIDQKIKRYKDSDLNVDEIELFINYVNQKRHLLKDRPQTFQHGDYHIGNFMINHLDELIVIDFDRFDYGDPWEEFNRIVWSAQKAPAFASGMIDGYFNHQVPKSFWELLLLYISNNTISSLVWGLEISEKEYQVMLNQMHEILQWYDQLKMIIPKWYKTKEIKV
jgi:aminoglycoside phosphotransferase (APT) family kinase protein